MKKIFISFAAGLAVGCLAMFGLYNFMPPKAVNSATVTSQTISGSPLVVNSVTSKNKTTAISTSYSGAGESIITVPDSAIPAAAAYDNQHWLAGLSISSDKAVSVLCGYRYKQIVGIGSIWCRKQGSYQAGLSVCALWMF